MPPPIPPLDEQEFDQPGLIAGLPGQDLNAGNNLFWYFTSSPWFEPMSVNIAVFNNVQLLPEGQQVMNDRRLWEDRLRSEPYGVQFVAAAEPLADGHPWLMQRQNKVPRPAAPASPAAPQVDTHVEGNWYTQGSRVLMAPSLLDVVQSRLLTISTRMQHMADLARDMTHWSPATGYSYYPPSYEAPKAAAAASETTAAAAAAATSATTAPTATASRAASPTLPPADADPTASITDFSDALFMRSLQLTHHYGDEFMDENPLKGEPGAFVFENTKSAVDARNKAHEQASQPSQPAPPPALASIDTQIAAVAPAAGQTPKGTATPSAVETHSRKGSVAPASKKKDKNRRKSQAGLASPTTPKPPLS